MENKVVLHLLPGLGVGGTEIFLSKSLPHIKPFDHVICTLFTPGPVEAEFNRNGIPVYHLNFLAHPIKAMGQFNALIKQLRPDILVTYLIHSNIFGRVMGRIGGVPKILCSVRSQVYKDWRYWPLFVVEGLTSFLVDKYFFNSPVTAKLYQKLFLLPDTKVEVIPNGVDVTVFTPVKSKPKSTKRLKIIGCVANLRKLKGQDTLIVAFSLLSHGYVDWQVELVGEGEYRPQLEKLISRLNLQAKVKLVGSKSNIAKVLQGFDIFVFASKHEGMSNALLEAMATGLPIVASDIDANRYLIRNNYSALLFEAGQSPNLADKIERLMLDSKLAKQLGRNARKEAVNKFGITRSLQKLNSLFNTV